MVTAVAFDLRGMAWCSFAGLPHQHARWRGGSTAGPSHSQTSKRAVAQFQTARPSPADVATWRGLRTEAGFRPGYDEVSCSPWLRLMRLEEHDALGLELKEEVLNLVGRANSHGRRQQFFTVSEL